MVALKQKCKNSKNISRDENKLPGLVKKIKSVVCPECGKPIWSNLALQIKKLEKLLKESPMPKTVKEEAIEFFAEILGKAEAYYLKKFARRQYHVTKAEEKTWQNFQNKKEIKNISDERLIEILEEFPVVVDWLSIPENDLSFKHKKALLLILRKIKK